MLSGARLDKLDNYEKKLKGMYRHSTANHIQSFTYRESLCLTVSGFVLLVDSINIEGLINTQKG